MDKYKFESEDILRMTIGKFMNLEVEDGDDLDTLCFEANNLREAMHRHVETSFDCSQNDAIFCTIECATAMLKKD